MTCPVCGEKMIGDGYHVVIHCPNAQDESWSHTEPDAPVVHCPLIHTSVWKAKGPPVPKVEQAALH
jgi:hypothetical protein